MRGKVRNVPHKRRYLGLAILALAVAVTAAMTTGAVSVPFAYAATPDTCGYSGGSTTVPVTNRSLVKFNEIGIIEGFSVTSDANSNPLTVNTFYSDEHALTIGATGTTWVATYVDPGTTITRIDDAGTNPANVHNPTTDATSPSPTTLNTGAAATDPFGREVAPSLYLTDVTLNAASKAGDWQSQPAASANTTGQRPDYVGGTWKNNGAANPLGSDGKEAKNGADLGPHSETFVNNISTSQGIEGYGAEVRWDTSTLDTDSGTAGDQTPAPGHTYRVQMMFHDGDHNADTGEACTTFTVPQAHPAAATLKSGGGTLSQDADDPSLLTVSTHDTANLSNGTANAGPNNAADTTGGRLTFRLYKQGAGTGGSVAVQEARCRATQITSATQTVVADNGADGTAGDYTSGDTGVYDFPDIKLSDVGTYHWTVQYSGNTENAPAGETLCNIDDEKLVVTKAPSQVSTEPKVKVTEDINITLTATGSAGIKSTDPVTIKLFKQDATATAGHPVGCTADFVPGGPPTEGGTALQQGNTKNETVADLGNTLTYPDDFGGASAPALTSGNYFWAVTYGGNSQIEGSNDDCTEFFSITL